MVFNNIWLLLWIKSKLRLQLASLKSITYCETLSNNPFQEACFGFIFLFLRNKKT